MKMRGILIYVCTLSLLSAGNPSDNEIKISKKIDQLLEKMTVEEKIGQMTQRNGSNGHEEGVRRGEIGSLLNAIDTKKVNELQRIAVEESRLGIPLIVGRDVIHGFRTIFPIPLGQAASWNPELLKQGTRVAALEAASVGIHWTFGPMMDITRDPRWGRIAECLGEDPYLASTLAVAMIQGFQTDDLTRIDALAACAKHYAGYGAAEGGRDYNTTYIPEQLLRDVYLKPFEASVKAGVSTLMTSFNDINGVPASGNSFLLRQILRDEWQFDGFVVSDWASITQMIPHGFCKDEKDAAFKAVRAGLDMEMATPAYQNHLKTLLEEGKITIQIIDDAVRNILRIKFRIGLYEHPYTDPSKYPKPANPGHLEMAKRIALQSIVLLKNDNNSLPLSKTVKNLAVIGPMADDDYEQLGTWSIDFKTEDTQTPLMALRDFIGKSCQIHYVKALETTRSRDTKDFDKAVEAVSKSDAALLFLGEEQILSGEARCRADIDLPGAQEKLIEAIHATGKLLIVVVMAGRPLTMGNVLDKMDALLYAFHPGTMGGPAIVDLLFGVESPSGKLPVTFPKMVGQIPIYYSHKNTGRPPIPEAWVYIDDIPVRNRQSSLGYESHYLDAGYKPQYPFGYGLSYTEFEYDKLTLSSDTIKMDESLTISAEIKNTGTVDADEIVQLYVRDLVGDITRPVRELKGLQRLGLKPGETKTVQFKLQSEDLAFHNQKMELVTEPGTFNVWIAPDSERGLMGTFELVEKVSKIE
jgi:beta-glucosidase